MIPTNTQGLPNDRSVKVQLLESAHMCTAWDYCVARQARLKLELETGRKLVSAQNAKRLLPSAKRKNDD